MDGGYSRALGQAMLSNRIRWLNTAFCQVVNTLLCLSIEYSPHVRVTVGIADASPTTLERT